MKIAYFMTDKMSCKFCTQDVLEKFMKEYGNRLLNEFLSKHTIRMPYQEIKQEILIATARALEAYNETRMDTKLTSYIWVCWENALGMIYRKQTGLQATAFENLTVSIEEAKDEIIDPISKVDEQLYIEYQNNLVYDTINSPETGLTQEEKDIIDMAIKGYSQKKIAKKIGCSQGKISKTYNRAINKIRGAITKNEQSPVANRKVPKSQNDEYSDSSLVAKAFWDVIIDPSTGFTNKEIFIFSKLREEYSLIDVAQLIGESHFWVKKMYKDCIKKIQVALGSLKMGV